jgi:glycosyltransferase involved in cell wall biosynthesis
MDLSVIIPNRNSPFLTKTIEDLLSNSKMDTEVIVNIDENPPESLVEDPRVVYLHPMAPIGMRAGINACVAVARGKYIMKIDDHCLVGQGYDRILIDNHKEDNWVQVPRRFPLDPINWKFEERTDDKYPIDYMYTDFPRKGKEHDDGTHGVPWKARREERKDILIDETPCFQGSCYFMTKNYFDNFLHGLHEEGYGQYAQETQEICFKTWLGGGQVMVNKKTYYAHLHKGKTYGRMYHFPTGVVDADSWSASHWLNNEEPGMVYKFEWLIDVKFPGMPGWPPDWHKQVLDMGWIKK